MFEGDTPSDPSLTVVVAVVTIVVVAAIIVLVAVVVVFIRRRRRLVKIGRFKSFILNTGGLVIFHCLSIGLCSMFWQCWGS